jgi:hypothetical protein
MHLRQFFLTTSLLISLIQGCFATILPHDLTLKNKHGFTKPLTISSLLKPLSSHKPSTPPNSVHYTFNGDRDGSIDMIRFCIATDDTCSNCNTAFSIITAGTPAPYTFEGTPYSISPAAIAAYLAQQSASDGAYNVGLYLQSSGSDCAGQHCSTLKNTASTHNLCMQATYSGGVVTALANNDEGTATLNTATSATTTIQVSVNTMGVSQGGTARTVTIINMGPVEANNVAWLDPFETGDVSGTCDNPMPVSGTCVLTITGTALTAEAYLPEAPVTLSISGTNTNTLTPTFNVVTYGSQYQSGYLYAIDDSTPVTESIGGSVASLTDNSAGIIWSSDAEGDVVYDNIPGIYADSTYISPTSCLGNADGSCNTGLILAYYPTINPLLYAAGICSALPTEGYTSWYLPAICELNANTESTGPVCTGAEASMQVNLPDLLLSSCVNMDNHCLAGTYWSSTESDSRSVATSPQYNAWSQSFADPTSSQSVISKGSDMTKVRCSRALASNPSSSPTAPYAPTGVTAIAGNALATVSWDVPYNGGFAITGYTVTSEPDSSTCSVSPPAVSCDVEGLTNGTEYTFTVVATNVVGDSSPSDASSSVTPATVPDAPTGVSATAGNAQATVEWIAPFSDGGYAITEYTVTSEPDSSTCSVSPPAVSCDVEGLTNGTEYTFTVVATNAVGDSLPSDASGSVTPNLD